MTEGATTKGQEKESGKIIKQTKDVRIYEFSDRYVTTCYAGCCYLSTRMKILDAKKAEL